MSTQANQILKIILPRPHSGQSEILSSRKRFNVANCGRRFGKTTITSQLITEVVLEGGTVAYFAPTYKMLSEVWREVKTIFSPVVIAKNEQERRLDFITGGVLELWSLEDPDASRGRKYKRAIIDEAAKARTLEDAWMPVIRPTLADHAGDAYFFSTPKGLNYFFKLWQLAGDGSEWNRWHFTTYDNPFIPRVEIDAMRNELPDRIFRQEIMAEFLEDGTYFQGVDEAATVLHPHNPADHEGHDIYMAIDWALSGDFTVIVVGCQQCRTVVDWDRFNKIDFTYQRERLYRLADKWKPKGALPERNSIGVPNIEIIRHRVRVLRGDDGNYGFNTSAASKPGLIQGLATAIEHDGFKVPAASSDELRAYEVELSTSGHPKFSAPNGQHDDWVMALALLWRAMTKMHRESQIL